MRTPVRGLVVLRGGSVRSEVAEDGEIEDGAAFVCGSNGSEGRGVCGFFIADCCRGVGTREDCAEEKKVGTGFGGREGCILLAAVPEPADTCSIWRSFASILAIFAWVLASARPDDALLRRLSVVGFPASLTTLRGREPNPAWSSGAWCA